MQEFRLTKNLVTAVLAAGCAAMAQGQTPPAQTARQTAAAVTAPTGNIVALPSKIAIIAIQQAVMATKEGATAGAALKLKYAPKQTEFEKRQADIQSLTDQLKKGGVTLSAEAKDKLQRDIDGKTKSLQRDAQDVNDDSQQDMGKVYNELGDKMVQIIEQYAYQNGYAVVLDVSSQQTPVIWAAPSTNITADIIKLYDQAHPGVAPAAAPKPLQAPPKQPATQTTVKKQ
jgi:outer membrane protein